MTRARPSHGERAATDSPSGVGARRKATGVGATVRDRRMTGPGRHAGASGSFPLPSRPREVLGPAPFSVPPLIGRDRHADRPSRAR